MGVSDTLVTEVKGISILVIIIVVFSIVLLKFKDVDGAACSSPYWWNSSNELCHVSGNASQNTTISSTGLAIDSAVSALQEPVTWIVIIVIILVVAWLMKYLHDKNTGL